MESVNFTSNLMTNLVRSMEAEGHTSITSYPTIPMSVFLSLYMSVHVYVHIFAYFFKKKKLLPRNLEDTSLCNGKERKMLTI